MTKLLVVGGSGFIGSAVCRRAVQLGYEVVGMARSGEPEGAEDWARLVTWVAADVFEPNLWRAHLLGCDAVVHAIGILKEKPDKGVTFARINGDSAILVAEAAEHAGVEAFVFVSASSTPPTVNHAYLKHKRRAEGEIVKKNLRPVILRPSLIHGPERPISQVVGKAMTLAQKLPGVPKGERPLSTEALAQAIVNAVGRKEVSGILDVDAIEALKSSDA